MFTAARLELARKRRGLTQFELANRAGVSSRSVSAYEAGETVPEPATVATLARVLQFPPEFFSGPEPALPGALGASFRAMSKMSSAQRDMALAAGLLAIEFSAWIEERFELPASNLPDCRHEDPEAAAASVRAAWAIGERPVRNVVHLLEAGGIRVFSLALECREVDAFSFWRDEKPFVFLNTQKSPERSRFDAIHELGHLILHRHGEPHGRQAEHEADAFASAFLMPKSSIVALKPSVPGLDRLVSLKRHWGVSVAALVRRLHDVGMLTDWQYRSLCIELSQRGYRTREPNGIPRESSQVLAKVFSALKSQGLTRAAICRDLRQYSADLNSLVFGLAVTSLPGGDKPDGQQRPARLRLVDPG